MYWPMIQIIEGLRCIMCIIYRRNISLLKIAEQQLQEDVRDKKSAADVDMSIVRLRRRKANHKWVLEGSKYM